MKRDVDYNKITKRLNEQLPKGVFLNVANGDKFNTMTIGWALTGIMWSKPVICFAVRPSRFTYKLLESTDKVTLSIPKEDTMLEELDFCGKNSGALVDKFEKLGFERAPIIKACDLHVHLKIVQRTMMDEKSLEPFIDERFYPKEDYHMFYFGQIEECYYIDEEKT